MKKLFISFFAFLLFCFCNNNKQPVIIRMSELTSDEVVVYESYDNLISKIGYAGRINWYHYRKYLKDCSYNIDSCKLLIYEQKGLYYLHLKDSVYLNFVNFKNYDRNNLIYNNNLLNNCLTISRAKELLRVDDSCIIKLMGESAMCGLDKHGYEFCVLGDSETGAGVFTFIFGSDSCLAGLYLPIP